MIERWLVWHTSRLKRFFEPLRRCDAGTSLVCGKRPWEIVLLAQDLRRGLLCRWTRWCIDLLSLSSFDEHPRKRGEELMTHNEVGAMATLSTLETLLKGNLREATKSSWTACVAKSTYQFHVNTTSLTKLELETSFLWWTLWRWATWVPSESPPPRRRIEWTHQGDKGNV